ncbi:MAG: hypothetical protein NC412_15195 [Roseburia sp.]|nr:hypothetical protein [Roseburia sp.]MCM1280123.1 hypothetical protein [Robinsoniella sp.]
MDNHLEVKLKIYKELKVGFQTMEEQIKEVQFTKEELEVKNELYEKCLEEHLLEEGAEKVKVHLAENKAAFEECDKKLKDLFAQRDAFRIEIEAYEQFMRDV